MNVNLKGLARVSCLSPCRRCKPMAGAFFYDRAKFSISHNVDSRNVWPTLLTKPPKVIRHETQILSNSRAP